MTSEIYLVSQGIQIDYEVAPTGKVTSLNIRNLDYLDNRSCSSTRETVSLSDEMMHTVASNLQDAHAHGHSYAKLLLLGHL
jgi:hypothetical protein